MGRDEAALRSVRSRVVAPVATLLTCYASGILLAATIPVLLALPPGEGVPPPYDAIYKVGALVVVCGGYALAGGLSIIRLVRAAEPQAFEPGAPQLERGFRRVEFRIEPLALKWRPVVDVLVRNGSI